MFAVLFLVFCCCFVSTINAADPPATWKEHCFEHDQNLTRVFFNNDVAIYYDNNMAQSISWPNTYLTNAWKYTKKVYGDFGSDGRLYAIFHSNRYSGGHPHTHFDQKGDYRNVIDCGYANANAWIGESDGDWNILSHEISHIVEFSAHGVDGSPAFGIWGDSKWAEIFQYDLYRGLGFPNMAQRWYDSVINGKDNFPRPGTQWFKDWFYPIYIMNGPDMGAFTLNKYFELLKKYFPKNGNSYARNLNMGEFVYFWSGATGYRLREMAVKAFGWTDEWEKQLQKAYSDYPDMPYNQIMQFYDQVNFQGAVNYQNLIGGCSNGLQNFNDRTSSVNTKGMCVKIYAEKDCKGDMKILSDDFRNQCDHSNLSKCGFDKKASSFNNCYTG